MFKKEIINNNRLNIFIKDKECELIHKFSLNKSIFYRDSQNNIIKTFFNNFMYKNEIDTHQSKTNGLGYRQNFLWVIRRVKHS